MMNEHSSYFIKDGITDDMVQTIPWNFIIQLSSKMFSYSCSWKYIQQKYNTPEQIMMMLN